MIIFTINNMSANNVNLKYLTEIYFSFTVMISLYYDYFEKILSLIIV